MRCSAWASFDGGGGRPLGAGSTGGPSSWWLGSPMPNATEPSDHVPVVATLTLHPNRPIILDRRD